MTYPNSQYVDPTVPHPAECDGCGRIVRDADTLDGNRNCASCQAEQAELDAEALEELRVNRMEMINARQDMDSRNWTDALRGAAYEFEAV